ncbi:cyclophilin type peptidyl-prolyl cis-trans isomerase/CLD domain-containing protein [Phthorimaea operculella]|nr:cyclophilin type peptidyl-prolyl cis-trans isomerase/CLD domain-containing protein [Phthorimaea operculella]
MTLIGAILKHVQSTQSLQGVGTPGSSQKLGSSTKIRSPPPEDEVLEFIEKERDLRKKRRKSKELYPVGAKVDTSPPRCQTRHMYKKIPDWAGKRRRLDDENIHIVLAIKKTHFTRGKVDNRWYKEPQTQLWAYYNRVNELKRISRDNKTIYKRLMTQGPKIVTTESLMQDWSKNRHDIVMKATKKFILFPPIPTEDIEDPIFLKPKKVKRPRVFFTLTFENGYDIGELQAELFTDVCPKTCGLFLELLGGDGVGFSYVGTHFFRKVPHLYWTGGDVAHDNGFGCYAQRGRRIPIGAENYHFSHSMPGLLSMPVTCDDEMCGIFNITFKALPQLDLRNVVFGRIVRPSEKFNAISHIGKLLSTQPSILLSASRQKINGRWVKGTANTMMAPSDLHTRILALARML